MNKLMMLVVAGLISNIAVADSSDPLGTGALEAGSINYSDTGIAGEFARVDHTDPLGTGAANSDDIWKSDISRSVSEPEIGDSENEDIFSLYEFSGVL